MNWKCREREAIVAWFKVLSRKICQKGLRKTTSNSELSVSEPRFEPESFRMQVKSVTADRWNVTNIYGRVCCKSWSERESDFERMGTGIATGYGMDGLCSIPGRVKRFFYIPQSPDPPWNPPSLIPNDLCMSLCMCKGWAIKSSPCTVAFNYLLCFPFN
jgi:hypothetical protein